MAQQHLSSADLLTLQVLERELTDPTITKTFGRELRARIEYLNASPTEKSKLRYMNNNKEIRVSLNAGCI